MKRPAFGRHQQGVCQGEVDSAWASEYVAFVVGATPLAAAWAVIFAQMVDDPSGWPEVFPTDAQEGERRRLFRLIEELVCGGKRSRSTQLLRMMVTTFAYSLVRQTRPRPWRSGRAVVLLGGHGHCGQQRVCEGRWARKGRLSRSRRVRARRLGDCAAKPPGRRIF